MKKPKFVEWKNGMAVGLELSRDPWWGLSGWQEHRVDIAVFWVRALILLANVVLAMGGRSLLNVMAQTVIVAASLAIVLGAAVRRYGLVWTIHALIPVSLTATTMMVALGGGFSSDFYTLYIFDITMTALHAGMRQSIVVGVASMVLYTIAVRHGSGLESMDLAFYYRVLSFLSAAVTVGFIADLVRADGKFRLLKEKESESRLARSRAFAGIAAEITAETDLERILQLVVNRGLELLGIPSGGVVLKDEEGYYRVEVVANLPVGIIRLAMDESSRMRHSVIGQKRTVVVRRGDGMHPMLEAGYDSGIITPIWLDNDMAGILMFVEKEPGRVYTEDECEAAEGLAQLAAVAISNSRLLDDRARRANYLATLNEIGRSLSASLDPDEIFELVYKSVLRIMHLDAFLIALYNPEERMVDLKFAVDDGKKFPGFSYPLNDGPVGRSIKEKGPVLIFREGDEEVANAQTVGQEGKTTKSILVVPMMLEGEPVGAVSVQSYRPKAYSSDDLKVLTTIANTAAIAINNARLYQMTKTMSLTDPVTQLGNQRMLHQTLEELLKTKLPAGENVALIMLDSDSLKFVNDSFGHSNGDKHLLQLANILRSTIRKGDHAVRYAGDEFMVVLPGVVPGEAEKIAERIRQKVEATPLLVDGVPVITTVSVGVAIAPRHGTTVDELIDAADAAMYNSKRSGKNRVSVA